MPAGGDDRRSRRSRRLISDALIELLQEQRYDRITVREIIDRADVGRSTFYTHFRGKEEVLASEFERVLDTLHRQGDAAGEEGEVLLPSLGLFRHVQEQDARYRALVRGHGVDVLSAAGHRNLRARAERQLAALAAERGEPPVPVPILADYLVGTFVSLLRWWLEHQMPYSPEQMGLIYQELIARPTHNAAFEHGS